MSETDTAETTVSARQARRAARAERQRRRALSPVRIVLSLATIPVIAGSVGLSIYLRTSPYDRADAMRHLMSLSGCATAARIGLAPAFAGELGYHERNDPDGDGIACEDASMAGYAAPASAPAGAVTDGTGRMAGGAKFVRP